MKAIRPIGELGNRVQEAGRIRMGVKTGRSMKALSTWRFTSPHQDCIEQLAALYGGTPQPWSDPKAAAQNQFEVITTSSQVRVLIPPGGLSQWYETWSGSRCERRCDGEECEVPGGPDGTHVVPCMCRQQNEMTCKPYTRLSVVLPDITFRGTWRLETKSWNAADELPAMERMIDSIQEVRDIIEAQLVLEQRSRMTAGGKGNFVVPSISLATTPEALAAGEAGLRPLGLAASEDARFELNAGVIEGSRPTSTEHTLGDVPPRVDDEDDVVEATVIYTPAEVLVESTLVANLFLLDPDVLERGVALGVSNGTVADIDGLSEDECGAAMAFLDDVRAERIEVLGVRDGSGRLRVRRHG